MKAVIVGAGQAGAWVARRLREKDANCSITLVGQEPWAPYERPPLSKESLTGEPAATPRFVLSAEEAARLDIRLLLGTTVDAIDRTRKQVITREQNALAYDKLVIATGGSARRLSIPGEDLSGVCYLRTWDDAVQLRERMDQARSALIVGGGWIGLEVASSARKLGLEVTLIEGASRLCARSLTPRMSEFLARQHASHGVELKLSCELQRIEKDSGGGLVVHTSQGSHCVDLVAVGIGLVPNVGLAVDCGLQVLNGIVVDASGLTSDKDIYATGDVANQPMQVGGSRIRLESYSNATNHAVSVADHIIGEQAQDRDIPWFWSDQFDFQLQVLGQPTDEGEWVCRGDAEDKFCLFELHSGQVRSVISVNMAKELKLAKRWMRSNFCPPAHLLSDTSVRLDKL